MARHDWESEAYVSSWTRRDDKELMLREAWTIAVELVRDDAGHVGRIVDLGSGPGGFLELALDAFPEATGVWVDESAPMRERARERLARFGERVEFCLVDASDPESIPGPADFVTSSRMIHHFGPERIARLYAGVHEQLPDGGWFANLDHFGAPGDLEQRLRRVKSVITGREKRSEGGHAHEAPFSTLRQHADWLTDAGFELVDFPWRFLYTALLVARKPG